MKTQIFLLTAALAFATCPVFPQTPEKKELPPEVQKILSSLKWQTGSMPIGGDRATLKLGNGFRYLDSKDAAQVLTGLWNNPGQQKTLGMIFPNEAGPLEADWAAVIEGFEEEGFVKDADADKLDPDKLLKDMQESQAAANKERASEGYPALEIVGWAVKPRYDKEARKLFWAIDIKRVGQDRHSVNYFIRILGRRGYLVVNLLGGREQLPQIEAATPQVLSMIEFNEGHRYADFDAKTDKVATYGIAGLIAGAVGLKVAAKLGLFALFAKKFGFVLLFLKKGWIFLVAGIAALWKKFFSKKDESVRQDPA
jgi:uncharacterized membrane-anchored protein